ncbi:unnamed protein product [Microthlaspi erraticum]|uniref:F-box domain-containing protein n=1 Tax=Microthlaspi erraticum TaxID=1685480 RepID=A0A6D2J085_9BRAS|nr:unnamed protein product [Microthlaspi erraticum]
MITETVEQPQEEISQPPSSFSSLPNDITENILARVSRWKYPLLSLVSKSFRSLVSSMQIYKTRSQIGSQERCFYLCLELINHPYPSWFSLWTKPNQTLTNEEGTTTGFNKDSCGNSVVPIHFASSHSPHIINRSILRVGSEIYIIGGTREEPSVSVRILDCRSHTWHDAPSMIVARENALADFMDEKIYVVGGCDIDEYSANWVELFDMKTQSWTALPGPGADEAELRNLLRGGCNYCKIAASEGKLYISVDEKEYAYEPEDGTWKRVNEKSSFSFDSTLPVSHMIENVIYRCNSSGELMWFDSKSKGRE